MKAVKFLAAVAATLIVAACFFSPGKFDAAMTIRKDGTFTYRYTGEVQMMTAHSAMTAVADREAAEEFNPDMQSCYDDDMDADPDLEDEPAAADFFAPREVTMQVPVMTSPSPDYRDCTPAELEQKKQEWERGRAERRAKKERETAAMKAMLGGMDPSDPKTMDEFARRLQGKGGWRKIVHRGNGLFDVDYQLSGRLDHDFVFPLFEGMDLIIPFVMAAQQGPGRVRVTAPAFVKPGGGLDGMGGMSAIGAAAMMDKGGENPWPFKSPEGTFTLTTDATILTNNTRDGPTVQGTSKVLKWTVTPLDTAKPEALIQL